MRVPPTRTTRSVDWNSNGPAWDGADRIRMSNGLRRDSRNERPPAGADRISGRDQPEQALPPECFSARRTALVGVPALAGSGRRPAEAGTPTQANWVTAFGGGLFISLLPLCAGRSTRRTAASSQ